MDLATPEEVVSYWVDTVGPEGWYKSDPEMDAEIRRRFEPTWEAAQGGGLQHWLHTAGDCLAYMILTDQYPRNMFRGDGKSFATDRRARSAALRADRQDWDMKIDAPQRQFFYLPLMHSEILSDQEQALRLILLRMPDGANNLLHARAHREVIRRYGRFPHRNAALGRSSSAAEIRFLEGGGYGAVVRELQSGAA